MEMHGGEVTQSVKRGARIRTPVYGPRTSGLSRALSHHPPVEGCTHISALTAHLPHTTACHPRNVLTTGVLAETLTSPLCHRSCHFRPEPLHPTGVSLATMSLQPGALSDLLIYRPQE